MVHATIDSILDELTRYAARCRTLAKAFVSNDVTDQTKCLTDVVQHFEKAWSGSFVGYQAKIYTVGFEPRRPGQHFDSEWGTMDLYSNRTQGEWAEYDHDYIVNLVYSNAKIEKPTNLHRLVELHRDEFDDIRDEVLPVLDALKINDNEESLSKRIETIRELKGAFSVQDFFRASLPKGQVMVRDPRAMQGGGFVCPPHRIVEYELFHLASYGNCLESLGKELKSIVRYLEVQKGMSGNTVAKRGGKIFIGHGGNAAWRDLKDFVSDRLKLERDEFDRQPNAGYTTKERLERMLNDASFAFLVMTAEDESGVGKIVARQNVVHEIGLFQGRLGFNRAIVMLENGCEEFSNIHGLTQLRFEKGKISSLWEDVRQVLEREGLL